MTASGWKRAILFNIESPPVKDLVILILQLLCWTSEFRRLSCRPRSFPEVAVNYCQGRPSGIVHFFSGLPPLGEDAGDGWRRRYSRGTARTF